MGSPNNPPGPSHINNNRKNLSFLGRNEARSKSLPMTSIQLTYNFLQEVYHQCIQVGSPNNPPGPSHTNNNIKNLSLLGRNEARSKSLPMTLIQPTYHTLQEVHHQCIQVGSPNNPHGPSHINNNPKNLPLQGRNEARSKSPPTIPIQLTYHTLQEEHHQRIQAESPNNPPGPSHTNNNIKNLGNLLFLGRNEARSKSPPMTPIQPTYNSLQEVHHQCTQVGTPNNPPGPSHINNIIKNPLPLGRNEATSKSPPMTPIQPTNNTLHEAHHQRTQVESPKNPHGPSHINKNIKNLPLQGHNEARSKPLPMTPIQLTYHTLQEAHHQCIQVGSPNNPPGLSHTNNNIKNLLPLGRNEARSKSPPMTPIQPTYHTLQEVHHQCIQVGSPNNPHGPSHTNNNIKNLPLQGRNEARSKSPPMTLTQLTHYTL